MYYIDKKMRRLIMLNRIGEVTNSLFDEFEKKVWGKK